MNIEVNTGGGSASADGGVVVIGNVEGSAIGWASGFAGTVNPSSLAMASAMLGGSLAGAGLSVGDGLSIITDGAGPSRVAGASSLW